MPSFDLVGFTFQHNQASGRGLFGHCRRPLKIAPQHIAHYPDEYQQAATRGQPQHQNPNFGAQIHLISDVPTSTLILYQNSVRNPTIARQLCYNERMIILPDFRIHQRDYLLKISRAITAQLDLEVVLRMVLEASVSMLGGEVGLIALRDPEGHLGVQAVLGVDPDQAEIFEPLLDLVNEEVEETESDSSDIQLRMRLISRKLELNLRQMVSLPMRISGEMLGIIFVFRPYPGNPTADDLRILQSFGDQAAIAVHNAGLYQATIAEKQRLATILDASADGIAILDANLRVMRINAVLSRMTGWQPEYALGREHADVIRWADPPPGYTLETAIAKNWPLDSTVESENRSTSPPHTFHVEGELERLDGLNLSVEIKYAPVFFEDGSLRNIIANVRDITRFREAEDLKNTFISVVSHELKTPVALIKGYASTLRRDDTQWDAETVQRSLTVIEEEADRLTELIDNLLMASRIQVEGMLDLHLLDVALDQIAARAVSRFEPQTQHHAFALDFEVDFPIIVGDEKRLRHVIDNLVSNAIKYSPNGGTITIGGRASEGQVQVFVRDEGIGLSPADAELIFDRFYRADNAVKHGAPGTGLGLYLVRAIIEAHGGHIWATPHKGQSGTTFTFTLPRLQQ